MFTYEFIEKVNAKCPYGQGIFVQPNGVPTRIKEPVIFSYYVKAGKSGGSCWDSPKPFVNHNVPQDHLRVLEVVLEELCPKITYLQYRRLNAILQSNEDFREHDYYGNFEDWCVNFITESNFKRFLQDEGLYQNHE